ncbi:MAG: DUF1877 family protein [Chloroflexi bacterium]|nr:DUF1877 family protein [Chloroflexota bacterium]
MGILTALYAVDKAVFETYKSQKRLKEMLDELVGLSDHEATFTSTRIGLDKAWDDFRPLLKPFLGGIEFDPPHAIAYRDMDVAYWEKPAAVWLLWAVADIAGSMDPLPKEQLPAAFEVLKSKMAERLTNPRPWRTEWDGPFTQQTADYVYSHLVRATHFLTELVESQADVVIVRVSA